MNKKKNVSLIALIMATCFLLSGCAGNLPFMNKEQDTQGEPSFTLETLGLEPDFSYMRKEEKPSVQVDRLGYLSKSAKIAVFQGKELPEKFQVVEKISGECVYEGEVRLKEEAQDGIYTGYGNFTDLEEEGSYYIECDKIGCSYYFTIGDQVYLDMAKGYVKRIEEIGSQAAADVQSDGYEIKAAEDICEMAGALLATYEIYPELLGEIWPPENTESEIPETVGSAFFRMLRKETDWLLSMQNEKTGGIYEDESALLETEGNKQAGQQKISKEATAAFAGTMAKYSYLYQQYDWDYANTCLKAAAKAWRYLDSIQEYDVSGRLYAASELYRASNEGIYHNYILQNQEIILSQEEDFYLLMGKVTYLSSKRGVDSALCSQFINGLMREAENIAEKAKEGLFLTEEKETDVILWKMTLLAMANYAIMNHEYVTVIENHVHYLLGRNEESMLLLENPKGKDAAKLLLLLSVVEAERVIIEASEKEEKGQ